MEVTQVEKPLTAYSENPSSDPVVSRCLSRTNVAKVDKLAVPKTLLKTMLTEL